MKQLINKVYIDLMVINFKINFSSIKLKRLRNSSHFIKSDYLILLCNTIADISIKKLDEN